MPNLSAGMRRRLFLAVLATAAATPSDLNVWFADPAGDVGAPPEEDTCYASTAFGQEYDAQAGCGAAAAVNGVALPADSYSDVTFIGNARNAIFITTSTWESADIGSASQYNVSIALQVSSESDDEVVLCSEAAMLREGYDEGLKNVAVTGLADPTSPRSDATIWPSDQGNTLYVVSWRVKRSHRATPDTGLLPGVRDPQRSGRTGSAAGRGPTSAVRAARRFRTRFARRGARHTRSSRSPSSRFW